ncbi:MAG TPA: LysM domain-containing protein, partial [Ilumatobacteraceae bacterium]|nr:LysM domain-containing protein [Ilumatobacteraceae bacterium]
MTFRLPAVLVGAAALVGLTACGSEAGTGASSQSTRVEISQPVYVTAPPVTTAATIAGQDQTVGGIVNEEQQYTVVFGDYLIGIAKKHCISLDTLVAYNNWPEGNKRAGNPNDVVRIPSGSCAPGTDLSAAATGSGQTGQTGGATAPTPSSAAPTTEYT